MTNSQTISNADQIVLRIQKAKTKLLKAIHPSKDYCNYMMNSYKELNNDEGRKKIYMFWNYRLLKEVDLLEKLERLPELIKK